MKFRTSTNPPGDSIHLATANPARIHQSNHLAVMILIAVVLITLAVLRFTQVASQAASIAAPSKANQVYDAAAAMRKSVVYSWEVGDPAPSQPYDATAAMQKAVVESWEVRPPVMNSVYDATAAMRESVVYSWEVKAARPYPSYDSAAARDKAIGYPTSK